MKRSFNSSYRGWEITVFEAVNQCSSFSFDIVSPDGYSQHVKMGGENELRAVERAKEMIDMEIAFADDSEA